MLPKIETLEEGFPDQKEILFNETHSPDRTFDVLETLYGGDPEEVSRKLKLYNEARYRNIDKIWRGHLAASDEDHKKKKVEYDRENARILKQIFPEGYPTYILISGHGSMIDCRESIRDPCFTLLPRGYKLILATATGERLSSSKRFMGEGYEQNDSSYYRMYEGLIPNQAIDFDLVYRKRGTKELITMEEEIILNASQTQEIISILGDTTTFGGGKADCFAPQHGVIFYDAKKQPIGHVTICMSCNHLESSHSIGANLYHYIIEQIQKDDIYIIRSGFSKLGRMRLAKFFKKCGLKYEYQRSIFE